MIVRAGAAFSVAAVITLLGSQAAADPTKAQCVVANGDAQTFRREGKLSEARAQLKLCMDPKCPSLVSTDCTKRLDELETAQPTVVFEVQDDTGHDVSTVKVTMDGRPLVDHLDGAATPVNPGEHTFTFTVPGQVSLTRKLVLREGEKGRRERVVIESAPSSAAHVTPAPTSERSSVETASPSAASSSGGPGKQKVAGLAIAGLGVAGLAVGSVFGLMTASATSRQKSDCASASSCNDYEKASSDHDEAVSKGLISTVAFIGGGALLVGGVALFLTARSSSDASASTARIQLVPSAGPEGGGMILRGAF